MTKLTPFKRILIANRGEIALRIIRTAKRLGYETVAVYSTADAGSLHVRAADSAICIGEPLPSQSYLRIDALIEAARATGADAVHPGYGFLAENAEFADACVKAGLVFIGPSAAAIRSMGNKAGAKDIMQKAGVPCVPGYQGADGSEAAMTREAERIGFPVMIKAVAGGGGRGMRLVADKNAFNDQLKQAQSEAQNAFGDATVILERAIVAPRHIEIQVFADRQGNAIHLGERDCSVQRRHQKLVEEAPSPAVTPELRARMGEAAVAAAKAIKYEGAGTLEFLLDASGEFYFMEMNTRLQVEHPVTEAITGLDLVEWQLRCAAGELLPLKQDGVKFSGHAIEVRLCAEDPARDFMPQSGRMLAWHAHDDVRVDSAMDNGCNVPPFYDSMIAKIIAHGDSREAARRKLSHALRELVALGVTTNREFLVRALNHQVFTEGGATTAFVSNHVKDLVPERDADGDVLAAFLVHMSRIGSDSRQTGAMRLAHRLTVPLRFEIGGKAVTASIRRLDATRFGVTVSGDEQTLTLLGANANTIRFEQDGIVREAIFAHDGDAISIKVGATDLAIRDLSHAAVLRAGAKGSDGKVRASMNGRVVSVIAKVGDKVAAGAPIIVLEAMKMQHVHAAPLEGTVTEVAVTEGEQVVTNFVVAQIVPAAKPAA